MRQPNYAVYTRELYRLATAMTAQGRAPVRLEAQAALNGQASEQLRSLVPLERRRGMGAFFTTGDVRVRFEALLEVAPVGSVRYWDPACGAGDLLLAAAARLPIGAGLPETLKLWGAALRGSDLEPTFVETAKLRLFIAAALAHWGESAEGVDVDRGLRAFRGLRVEDGFSALRRTRGFRGHILMNPPYGAIRAELGCDWSSGLTSQAAMFALAAVRGLAVGGNFSAILPDVLRSGSRYEVWRARMGEVLAADQIAPYGQFDQYTDVDVFLMAGTRRHRSDGKGHGASSWWPELLAKQRAGDAFEIGVGPVVDNRSPHAGPNVPFLTARGLPPSGVMGTPSRTRQFAGRLTQPPFVALRRTSRPGQGRGGSTRAAGVVVTGDVPVAVDNHIITARPLSGREMDCLALLKVLDSEEVNDWLDQRIRCRHLTVGIVRDLPWPVE